MTKYIKINFQQIQVNKWNVTGMDEQFRQEPTITKRSRRQKGSLLKKTYYLSETNFRKKARFCSYYKLNYLQFNRIFLYI